MKTDKQIYQVFQAEPQWIFDLTGLPSPGKSSFRTVALKALERTADGVNLPEDTSQAITIVEIQFQKDDGIYTRIVVEMALIQQANAWRAVQGIIFFRDRSLDPKTPPWNRIIHAFSLNELLSKFEQANPHHPLAAVFKPVFVDDEQTLAKNAGAYYRDIKRSTLDAPSKAVLFDVFVNWLLQRLTDKDRKEIEAMLIGELPSLEETKAGKELIRIGEERGKQQGMREGKKEGKKEGVQEALLILVRARIGKVPADLRRQLNALDLDKVEQLLPLVAQWDSVQPLRKWLADNAG